MTRFYFDLEDGNGLVRDEEGTDLPGYDDARYEAVAMLPQIAKDRMPDGEELRFVVTVRQAGQASVYRATLSFHGERLDGIGARPN